MTYAVLFEQLSSSDVSTAGVDAVGSVVSSVGVNDHSRIHS